MSTFNGFPPEGLEFLRQLGGEDKAWFDANRATYDTQVVTPTKLFVTAVGERLANGFAPQIVAVPKTNGSIAPINNDLRFSPDKSPYKDHLLLRFWEGPNKKTAPTLFIRLGFDDVGFAVGAAIGDLDRWRQAVDDPGSGVELADALVTLGKRRTLDLAGEGYKNVPKPYDQDHPRAHLLRFKGAFQARWSEPLPAAVSKAGFVDHCLKRLEACADVHRWLLANLA